MISQKESRDDSAGNDRVPRRKKKMRGRNVLPRRHNVCRNVTSSWKALLFRGDFRGELPGNCATKMQLDAPAGRPELALPPINDSPSGAREWDLSLREVPSVYNYADAGFIANSDAKWRALAHRRRLSARQYSSTIAERWAIEDELVGLLPVIIAKFGINRFHYFPLCRNCLKYHCFTRRNNVFLKFNLFTNAFIHTTITLL
ncbi:hypothetical protein ALC53_06535 [Atta colombica]|uniref:Uncharacterized protein n=1 Tax=Atta colombica TaxID=520822 RepID=A0A195BGH2_9HYME|nr:hypothetical protein ALC53_06535 [Atta colombica]